MQEALKAEGMVLYGEISQVPQHLLLLGVILKGQVELVESVERALGEVFTEWFSGARLVGGDVDFYLIAPLQIGLLGVGFAPHFGLPFFLAEFIFGLELPRLFLRLLSA